MNVLLLGYYLDFVNNKTDQTELMEYCMEFKGSGAYFGSLSTHYF